MKNTFYGGKNGYDIVCLKDGKVVASGKKLAMMKLSRKYNYAVAKILPLRFEVLK